MHFRELMRHQDATHDWELPTDMLWKVVLYHLQNADAYDWDLISAKSNII